MRKITEMLFFTEFVSKYFRSFVFAIAFVYIFNNLKFYALKRVFWLDTTIRTEYNFFVIGNENV